MGSTGLAGPDGGRGYGGMTGERAEDLRALEGRHVGIALADQSCIDDAILEAVVSEKLWVHAAGDDLFVPLSDVMDVWEVAVPARRRDAHPTSASPT